jgi:AcrR family transcriptional regulator
MSSQSSPAPHPAPETARGEQTRRLVVDTAVRLFGEQGYEKTTMRAIAKAAGLSVGNAYYYFPTKDHLVQEFYRRIQEQHRDASAAVLATETTFAGRLTGVCLAGLDVMGPYHSFAGKFIRTAVEPGSPLSPFSAESVPAKDISLTMFRQLVDGSPIKVDNELRAELPELLWLGYLGITLYWVHDTSDGQAKTRHLVDAAVPLVDRLVRMSRLPMLRQATRDGLALVRELR